MDYQRDLFKTLVNKLHLQISMPCFQDGMINELLIHDRSNRWSFSITLNQLMPYQTFIKFDDGVKKLFSNASFLSFVFKVKDEALNYDLVKAYWPWIVNNSGLSTIMAQQLMTYGHLKIVDNHVSIDTKNEALRGFLANGALVQIEDCYYRLGFPRFKINVLGGKVKLPAKIIDFKIEKNASDIKLAKSAADALDNDSPK